jgi:pimeloyl-ACP methyl ester carboxylesterase
VQALVRNGNRLYYREAGSGDPAVLLVHGWTCDHRYLEPQLRHLRRSHRVVAVDLLGHGRSDKPKQDYPISGFAEDLAFLIEQLGLSRPVAIGHSMGALVCVELARQLPDRVAAVVLLDAGPIVKTGALRATFEQLVAGLRTAAIREVQRDFIDRFLFLPSDDLERRAWITREMLSGPEHVAAACFQGMAEWDGEAALRALRIPVLHIAAERPPNPPAALAALCPQLVNGQTVGAGHFHQLEVPEQVNAMIDRFLAIHL